MLDLCVFVTRPDRHERKTSESGGNLLFNSGRRAVIRLVSVVSGLVSQDDQRPRMLILMHLRLVWTIYRSPDRTRISPA
jgi:hypothetical protein